MEKATYTYIYEYDDGSRLEREFVFTLDTKIYASVKHVTRTGMTRTVTFYMIEDGELINITHVIAQCLGYKLNESNWTIKVQDIFSVMDRFANALRFKKCPTWVEHYGKI